MFDLITKNETTQNRLYYLDYLRSFSSLAIILLHVASNNMNDVDVTGFDWNVFNIYNGLVRWGVPVFVMISGALFLPREIDTKKLYSKNILRMVTTYVVWSAFYAVVTPIGKFIADSNYVISVSDILKNTVTGAIHMWFIPMIIGIYICIPLIKPLTKNKTTVKYFLILSFIFLFLRTQVINITNDFLGDSIISSGIKCIEEVLNNMSIHMVLGYVPYFILGYVLNETEIKPQKRTLIYILGILGFIITVLLNAFASMNANKSLETYYGISTINVAFMSIAVFVWFKYNVRENDRFNKLIVKLSKYSFGAYLVHIFVLMLLTMLNLEPLSFNTIISVPVITVITAVTSFFISFVMNQIPIVKKYIV